MLVNKEFKVNDYLTLRLEQVWAPQQQEEHETVIYVAGEWFRQCKYLLLNILVNDIGSFDEIDSIDEASAKLDHSLERNSSFKLKIPAEVEFWGHCSNLQMWAEFCYDTRLLHSNLAFPLLKKLTEAGDPIAKRVFREEIAKRLSSGFSPVIEFLAEEGYLKYLTHEEIVIAMLELKEAEAFLTIEKKVGKPIEILTELHEGKIGVFAIVKNRRVETLSLHKCELKSVPKEIKSFAKVKEINLTSNSLSIVPKWVLDFKNLQYLLIAGNQIKSLPEWIGKLKWLKYLDVGYNPIEMLPESIVKLESIEYFDVECCPLKQFPDLSSEHLSRGLKDLNHFFNEISKKEVKKNSKLNLSSKINKDAS